MLTRSQVAHRLGRSVSTVRKMEGRILHPTVGVRGVRIFDAEEVEELAERIRATGRALDRAQWRAKFSDNPRACRRDDDNETSFQLAKLTTWRERVERAAAALLECLPPLEDDAWEAADHLARVLADR